MQKTFVTIAALCALFAANTASADTIETVVISATRTEQPLEKTGASLTLITSKDLQTQQTVALTDILKEVPSLIVNRNGGLGQPASISLRGGEAGQTIVLIDGIRVNDPSTTDDSAAAALGDLLVNNIERVEVLRGPQSTLYGSDAIGGMINIVTKRGSDGPFRLNGSVEGGSFGTFHANVAANGSAGGVEYGAALNYLTTSGISASDPRNPLNAAARPDGYRNYGATFNVRAHLDDSLSIDARAYYTNGHEHFDDGFGPPPNFLPIDSGANNTNDLKAGYLGLNADFLDGKFHNRVALIATSSDRQFFDSASDPATHLNFEFFSSTVRLEYQGVVDLDADDQITFGAETQESTFRNDNFGLFALFSPPTETGHDRLSGYYAQAQTTFFAALTLTGGIRLDSDDQFGTHTSFKFNGAWQLSDWDATLRANVGNAFKAPSLFQEFGPNSNPIAPLQPETATGWEAGLDKNFWGGGLNGSLTYFARETTNQIDFQNCFSPTDAPGCPSRVAVFGYYVNLDRTRTTGVEASLAAPLMDGLSVSLNATYLAARNTATGRYLSRRPHYLASAVITWRPLVGATLGTSVTYQGKRFDDAANFMPLTSNMTVNLFGSYDLTENWQLFGRVDNLFNDRTEEIKGFGVPGIAAFGGVRAAF